MCEFRSSHAILQGHGHLAIYSVTVALPLTVALSDLLASCYPNQAETKPNGHLSFGTPVGGRRRRRSGQAAAAAGASPSSALETAMSGMLTPAGRRLARWADQGVPAMHATDPAIWYVSCSMTLRLASAPLHGAMQVLCLFSSFLNSTKLSNPENSGRLSGASAVFLSAYYKHLLSCPANFGTLEI